MKVEKKTAEYTVLKRRDGRFAVKGKNGKFINAEEKLKVLMAEGLVKAPEPKKVEPEAPAEEAAENEEAPAAE